MPVLDAREDFLEVLQVDALLDAFAARNASSTSPSPIDLCAGTSSFDLRPHVDLSLKPELLALARYGDPQGLQALRTRIAELYAEKQNVSITPDQVLITDGGLGALLVSCASLLQPGDEVILPEVSFPPYRAFIRMFGARPVYAPLNGAYTVDIEAIRRLISPRTRFILINSPSNPHGTVLSRRDLEAIVDLGVPIVSDEVYSGLAYDAQEHSLLEVSREHIVINSFSKVYAMPGIRLGYLVAPQGLMGRLANVKLTVNLSSSLPSQLLALAALRHASGLARAHCAWLRENRDGFLAACAQHQLKPMLTPVAAFYGLIDVRDQAKSTATMARDLIAKHNVAVFPGADFALDDPGFLRVNFGSSPEHCAMGIGRIRDYLCA